MIDNSLDNLEKWFRITVTSLWAGVVVYYLAPQYHSFLGLCRAVLTSIAVSTAMFVWWLEGGPLTEYQELIIIIIVSSVADCLLVGGLKVLVMFRTDPIGTFLKLRGRK